MKQLNNNSKFKRGGVSMFLVVIFGSLMALMVASYMRLVIRDQSQASSFDLSQSAYDSAQAGVEDAKVFLARFSSQCRNGIVRTPDCDGMIKQLRSDTCNAIRNNAREVQVQITAGDNALNQAYTCLKIRRNTPDFLGKVTPGSSKIIPLKGAGTFNRIRLHWNTREDMNGNNTVNLENTANPTLSTLADWNVNRPAVLKAQYFGYTGTLSSADQLDNNFSTNGTGLDEQIYYPVSDGPGAVSSTKLPGKRRGLDDTGITGTLKQVTPVRCHNNMNSAIYSCNVTVDLGHTVQPDHTAFVRLTPIYKAANFKVELLNNNAVIDFNGVQPIVDSTGRANNKFRRIESRIEFQDQNLMIPDFALQLYGDQPLCKDFYVTNETSNVASATESCRTEVSAPAGG